MVAPDLDGTCLLLEVVYQGLWCLHHWLLTPRPNTWCQLLFITILLCVLDREMHFLPMSLKKVKVKDHKVCIKKKKCGDIGYCMCSLFYYFGHIYNVLLPRNRHRKCVKFSTCLVCSVSLWWGESCDPVPARAFNVISAQCSAAGLRFQANMLSILCCSWILCLCFYSFTEEAKTCGLRYLISHWNKMQTKFQMLYFKSPNFHLK